MPTRLETYSRHYDRDYRPELPRPETDYPMSPTTLALISMSLAAIGIAFMGFSLMSAGLGPYSAENPVRLNDWSNGLIFVSGALWTCTSLMLIRFTWPWTAACGLLALLAGVASQWLG